MHCICLVLLSTLEAKVPAALTATAKTSQPPCGHATSGSTRLMQVLAGDSFCGILDVGKLTLNGRPCSQQQSRQSPQQSI